MVSELKIVLASSSPRRIRLLRELGVEFTHMDPTGKEDNSILDPGKRVEYNSLTKAMSLVNSQEKALIIGSDTVVHLNKRILGKPKDEADAKLMLRELSGNCNQVYTGISIVNSTSRRTLTRYTITKVWFKNLSDSAINEYVSSGEPLDKAGAYGIQGLGGELVDRFEGSYSNVIGFPLELLFEMLQEFGISI